jgi:hypothetical protein
MPGSGCGTLLAEESQTWAEIDTILVFGRAYRAAQGNAA